MGTRQPAWRRFAWNGVRFEAPSSWEAARIGARDLLFENTAGPTMEVKWGPVKGKFSHRAQLKRLSSGKNRKAGRAVTAGPLPARWQAALNSFEATGFSWDGARTGARGAILYCLECRQASLIQFFHHNTQLRSQDAVRVLSSFRDHGRDGWNGWSLFDIQARLPNQFLLSRHRFAAGRFELSFEFKHQKLYLHRWAPASVLLSETDLDRFARQQVGFPSGEPVATTWAGCPAVEWTVSPGAAYGARWWGRIKAKHPYKWLRLWHLKEKNRILALRAEGRRSFDPELLYSVCSSYEVV